jgi:hypothetical protein
MIQIFFSLFHKKKLYFILHQSLIITTQTKFNSTTFTDRPHKQKISKKNIQGKKMESKTDKGLFGKWL